MVSVSIDPLSSISRKALVAAVIEPHTQELSEMVRGAFVKVVIRRAAPEPIGVASL